MSGGPSTPTGHPVLHLGAFLRTLIAPLIVWSVAVFSATAAGQPGVVCITPMAWLLALWSGGAYIRYAGGYPGRWPLFGPALVGALLGIGMSILFILVTTQYMPVGNDPGEVSKMQVLTAVLSVGGILVCTTLSLLTAHLTLRRLAASR